jgi:hypothetical protein
MGGETDSRLCTVVDSGISGVEPSNSIRRLVTFYSCRRIVIKYKFSIFRRYRIKGCMS